MLRLPRLISDGMVLQQKKRAHIRGWDRPGSEVMVSFLGKEFMTTTDESGQFSLFLDALMPGGPYTMEIRDSLGEEIVLEDIWVGDVWICAGQSNMELPMARVKDKYPEEIADCKNPAIRTFKIVEHTDYHGPVADHLSGQWKVAGEDTILDFSATAYFFAREMNRRMGIPVGLINASLGGSRIESWMSREMLAGYDDFLQLADKYGDDAFLQSRVLNNEKQSTEWHQRLDAADRGLLENWKEGIVEKEEKNWKEIQLPFFFSDTELADFIGSVWFCRKVTVPASLVGKPVRIWLGTIVDSDTVYVNGQWVGQTEYQYPPRKYTIPEGLLTEGENTIVIRVKCENGHGRFTPGKEYAIFDEKDRVSLQGKWFYRVGAECEQIGETDFVNWKPTGLYNGMMAPCHFYTIAGILWYQGEANSWNPDNYFDLTSRMVDGYRKKWKDEKLPYLYVQLPNFSGEIYDIDRNGNTCSWAPIREMQRRVLTLPDTGMVVAMDLGEDNDLHPLNKKEVGSRLALQAMKNLYGLDVQCAGPVVREVTVDCTNENRGDYRMIIRCDNCRGGMYGCSKEKGNRVNDFEILDEMGNGYRTKVTIQGDTLVLDCDGMLAKPVTLRYCYGNTNKGALIYNKEGFPMSPFIMNL